MPNATISAAGLRVMKLLAGSPPKSVTELVRATGVTRTAITEQLNGLEGAGLVERAIERLEGRGRPRHIFSATNAALSLLFANNQHLLVPAMWQAIGEAGGPELMRKIAKRVSRSLAEHYSAQITATDPKERLRQFVALLREEGGLVEMGHKRKQTVVHKRTCPFISMVDEQHTVCTIDLDMMNAVVGRTVRRTACRHEGAPCCILEIDV
jgi:predicted ArsR family transcriptional regulator